MASWNHLQEFMHILHGNRGTMGEEPTPNSGENLNEAAISSGPPDEQYEHSIPSIKDHLQPVLADGGAEISAPNSNDSGERLISEDVDDGRSMSDEQAERSSSRSVKSMRKQYPSKEYIDSERRHADIAQENDELKTVIKNLCAKMNIRASLQALGHSSELGLYVSPRLIRILSCELQSLLSATGTSESLRQRITQMLNTITPQRALQMTRKSMSCEGLEFQQDGVFAEDIEFERLDNIFPPGELVYMERSELAINGVSGRCWRVNRCEYTETETTRFFTIKTSEWKWESSTSNFRLVCGMLHIEEYTGKISLGQLGIVPVAMMETNIKDDVQERLISRGKLYMHLFKSGRGLWEYYGPGTMQPPPADQFLRGNSRNPDDIKNDMLAASDWDSLLKTRAIITASIPQICRNDEITPHVMNTSEPIHDETYMMLSPYLWVRPVTSLAGPLMMVHLDHMCPVVWNEAQLEGSDDRTCVQILSTLRSFQQSMVVPKQLERRSSRRPIIIVYGDMVRTISIMEAVAERDRRGLFEIDLLDLVRFRHTSFEVLKGRLNLAARLQGLVLLQNFATLVAKRSYHEQRQCAEITRFIEFLEVYPEIVVICLQKDDTVDGKLRKLGPVYFNLDDDITDDDKTE